MTRRSTARHERGRKRQPKPENIAAIIIDHTTKQRVILTNDMLVKQIHREGPNIAASFDKLTSRELSECSKFFAKSHGLLLQHLPRVDDRGSRATLARLIANAANSYVASIEVARHGFPRQYGALARMVVETLATAIVIATKPDALKQFHEGTLPSSKCVTWAKNALPILGRVWGMLSKEFVHIGKGHATLEIPKPYAAGGEEINFITSSVVFLGWLLYVVTELIYSDEVPHLSFWRKAGGGVTFDPTPEGLEWMEKWIRRDTPIDDRAEGN